MDFFSFYHLDATHVSNMALVIDMMSCKYNPYRAPFHDIIITTIQYSGGPFMQLEQ